MLNCDEIVIELSREQSVSNSGAGVWTNQIPDLILEEGDQITCEGGWISVSNSGDGSIEILDNQNPDNNNVDASFYVSYYKVMDSKNCVAFPYHSLKQLEGDKDFTGYGFNKPLPESDVATTERYKNIPTYNGQNITEVATYQSLINEKDADKYTGTTAEEYLAFLINADFKQSIRDLANTGNYYTALYRKDNGQYELLQRKVDVVIPKGYYSPDNLASFITEQIQTKYFNESVDGRPPETWTNCGRYVNAMTQVSVPNLNLGFFDGNVDMRGVDGVYRDFISTNSAPRSWTSDGVAYQGGIPQPIYGAFGTGFTGYYPASNCLIRYVSATSENNYVPARPQVYPSVAGYPEWYMIMDIKPANDAEREDLTYLMNLANNYTGLSTQFNQDTGVYPPNNGNSNEQTNNYGGFNLSIFMMINTISTTLNTIIWGGEIAYNINRNPLLTENKPITYIEELDAFRIIFTMNVCNDMILYVGTDSLFNHPPRTTILTQQFYDQSPVWTADVPDEGTTFTGGVLLSAGGVVRILDKQPYTPYTYNFRLPIGVPMYCGLPRLVIGEGADNYRQLFVNNSTPYSWFTFQNKQPITTDYNPATPSVPPTSTPTMSYNVQGEETKSLTDYQNGNKYLGMTCCNFSRWSLRNDEEPDRVTNPETNPDVMPILRKYPLFMKYGMATNQYAYKDGEYNNQGDPIYPAYPSAESTLTFNTLDQTGKTIFTNQVYTAILPNGYTALENWWDFINAQIQDGLIDIDGGDETYFYAYTHFCIQDNISPDEPDNSVGSDTAIQTRPRGLLVKIHRTSFLNKSVVTNYVRGFLINDNNLLGCDALSWIYDKINGEGFGFMDATFFATNSSISHLQTNGYRLGWGYSYKKTGWRNYTSMLCSYAVEESDETTFMFDSSKSRQLTCNPRVYLGCETANLTFDGDGSSRFYWSDFFLTNKYANKYNEGVTNNGGTYSPSIQQPFYNIYKGFAYGVSGDPPDGGGAGIVWSNDIPANTEAGTEVIQYNKSKRDLYNDGLFQLAPEMTKHLPCITGFTTNNSEQGSYVTGNVFPYCFPVDTDYSTRFFCFDADVRYNTWEVGQYEYPHTTTFVQYGDGGGVFADWGLPTNVTSFNWSNWDGDYNNGTTDPATANVEGAKYLTTSRFWGSMSGDTGFIDTTSEAGTCRPDKLVIYDSPSGIQVFNWGNYNRENWDKSFWDIIGFRATDMMPTPFMYCGQQRNFTTNFMTSSSSTFRTHSYPMRNDADLTISGFVDVTTNIQGQLQYVLQYPRQNYISSVGLMGINNLEQNAYTFVGGTAVAEGITTYFPYQFTSYVKMNTTGGGATYLNGQLLPEEFAILYSASTKNYASDVADKLQSPFYLIRCNLAEDNFKYTNNAVVPSVMPIMGVISKQYGATSDWYYSTDSVGMLFTNRRRRVLNEVKISITEKSGRTANTIQPKSTIFFKIRRAEVPAEPVFDADTENLLMMEQELNQKQKKLYQEELDYLLS
jgi:hypothetical protein